MAPPRVCCNPFQKVGHNSFKDNLTFISDKWKDKFSQFYGFHICTKCKRQLYRYEGSLPSVNVTGVRQKKEDNSNSETDEDQTESSDVENKDQDYVNKAVDNKNKRLKLAAAVQEIIAQPTKTGQLNFSDADNELLRKSIKSVNIVNSELNNWISEIKMALSRAMTRNEKIACLTTIPLKWSIRKTAKEFGVSRRMVSTAKKLQTDEGYGAQPKKKQGRALNVDVIEKVKTYFLSDEVSRVQPGMKDVKSVVIDGHRQRKTVSKKCGK